ncbi:MAG: outer membrane beta-barrel protein [Xanthobacteraceae bacterium]|nr:outer membrane beta-barrel protein [Xanthobacteraceae bacterium]
MKNYLFRTAALPALLAAGQAMGQGLPASPYNWTGFYLGANAGANWARSHATTSASSTAAPGFGASYFFAGDVAIINGIGSGSMAGSGFAGGAQAGYNWQVNSTVVGLEADFGAFHGKASRTATGSVIGSGDTPTITSSVDADWLFTARGRLGWAFGNLLPYVTGGVAVTHLSATNSYSGVGGFFGVPAGTWSASKTKVGWVIGGGLEWALARNWSARVEYLHVDFSSINASGVVSSSFGYGSAISTSTDLSADVVRAGLSYRF